MATLGKTICRGHSGEVYRLKVYALGTRLRKESGLYVITCRSRNAEGGYRHVPVYVGQTEDLSQPIGRHRRLQQFKEHGANCICLQPDVSEKSRRAKEADLIAKYHPVCNG